MPSGTYAFAAVAKTDDCSVLATGCVEANVPDTDSVAVPMSALDPPTGACGTGASCQAARCVPANDNANPSVGAGCSLELLGSGPLANPVGGGNTLVSAPAIAATPSGFVIVYREIDPNGASARITVLPIDPGGGASDPQRPLLRGRCAGSEETDGVGLLMNGSDGQIVLARAACAAQPGLELLGFTSTPQITVDPNFHSSDSIPTSVLSLSMGHVAADRSNGSGVLAFIEDGQARVATIQPGQGIVPPNGSFGGASAMTGAWVAASDGVLALLAAGPPVNNPDAGADASTADPETGPMLRLIMAPPSTNLTEFDVTQGKSPRPVISFPGSWGAMAARGTRVIVASDGSGPGRSVSYRTFDVDTTDAKEVGGFSMDSAGVVTGGDVYIEGDRVFFAVIRQGAIELHAFANASTSPTPLHSLVFAKEPRIAALNIIRDGRVAVAATESRVAVAWTTASVLKNDDTTGGYAVFACTP
ncbi:hypothetical protein AKJ09_07498 [Labilithrix luteola]|uniref:Uncharacterized protein n=1 Tax=Labilithrix luteola TaxID=1391654 RepID=A0A0K1Q608_9BACT|nr:hypothetical protein [Labilithrix luteola]AKV00835.1 hypothetical protein AKJ09_07498 [Labilithrix luteola]